MSPLRLQDLGTNANAEGYVRGYMKMHQNVNLNKPGILVSCILLAKVVKVYKKIEVYCFQPSISQYKQYANVVY